VFRLEKQMEQMQAALTLTEDPAALSANFANLLKVRMDSLGCPL
jgi:hypothetical protein